MVKIQRTPNSEGVLVNSRARSGRKPKPSKPPRSLRERQTQPLPKPKLMPLRQLRELGKKLRDYQMMLDKNLLTD